LRDTVSKERKLPTGEYLFREGETAEFAYVLKNGSVELIKSSIDGDLVLAEIEPGTLLEKWH
jgi:cAMP-binding proteins - catabolite gene activator and regulatory subunit of cAMP-dependent protein kinases